MGAPAVEYYLDEKTICESRQRASALDVGAFESTTAGPGIGPYGAQPDAGASGAPDGSASGAGGGTGEGGAGGGGGGGAAPMGNAPEGGTVAGAPTGSSGGCGCRQGTAGEMSGTLAVALAALGVLVRRARRRRVA
jgi:MYXO-CTERM domain-containing protein